MEEQYDQDAPCYCYENKNKTGHGNLRRKKIMGIAPPREKEGEISIDWIERGTMIGVAIGYRKLKLGVVGKYVFSFCFRPGIVYEKGQCDVG